MPVSIESKQHSTGATGDAKGEIARLRREVEALKRRQPAEPSASHSSSKLSLCLAALALLISVISLLKR